MCYVTIKCHNCGAASTLYDGMAARCPHCGATIPEKAAGKLENLLGCAREIDKDLRNAAEQGAELFTVEVRNFHVPAHKSKW